ncbi:MAG: alpha/beta hydrolase [Pseudomonadota bacterium]
MNDIIPYSEVKWQTRDGLICHASLFRPDGEDANKGQRPGSAKNIVCIPGLTRNGADFFDIATLLASEGFTTHALTLRGRGSSDRDTNYRNYHPAQYCDDVLKALDFFELETAIFIGTSLGGITTMLLAEQSGHRIEKAIINDVGPRLAPGGLERIGMMLAGSTGKTAGLSNEPTDKAFSQALATTKEYNQQAFPNEDEEFWQCFVKRTYTEVADGQWIPNYDPNIVQSIAELGPGPDLWPGFRALKSIPTLLIHGALSDLLTRDIVDEMTSVHPQLQTVTVNNVGHAPMLTEPQAWKAITKFIT